MYANQGYFFPWNVHLVIVFCFSIPNYVLEPIGVKLPLENTLIMLQRHHSLAFGFETFAFRQKTKLSRLTTVFKR